MAGIWLLIIGGVLLLLFLPRYGLVPRGRRWRKLHSRILVEDALKHLLRCQHAGERATLESLAGALRMGRTRLPSFVARMEASGLLRSRAGGLVLTGEGERLAVHVVRAHRLWERYLADEAGLPLDQLHRAAEREEHRISADQLEVLDAHLGHPRSDPHGDPIPTAEGEMIPHRGVPLTDWPLDEVAEVVHVEDEPEPVFHQVIAAGFRPGTVVRVLERSRERLVVSDGEAEHFLAPVVAANVHVGPVAARAGPPVGAVPLAELPEAEVGEVVGIDPAVRGLVRRRLLDLGLTPGARVRCELTPTFGEPRAFRVRGTLVALRREQAAQVWVRPAGEPEPSADAVRGEG
ncbi:MAG: FeoA domain-containing protein [Gemmatimonadetes bacterium]|nr:FeoA domain-containing protein [Gemmatimonadota bacterium]